MANEITFVKVIFGGSWKSLLLGLRARVWQFLVALKASNGRSRLVLSQQILERVCNHFY